MADEKKGHLYKNAEGYPDPTVGCAMANIAEQDRQRYETMCTVIHLIKATAELAGFEVIGRITLMDKKSGKKYK